MHNMNAWPLSLTVYNQVNWRWKADLILLWTVQLLCLLHSRYRLGHSGVLVWLVQVPLPYSSAWGSLSRSIPPVRRYNSLARNGILPGVSLCTSGMEELYWSASSQIEVHSALVLPSGRSYQSFFSLCSHSNGFWLYFCRFCDWTSCFRNCIVRSHVSLQLGLRMIFLLH